MALLIAECRGDEGPCQLQGHRRPDHPGTQAENVHVVMFYALMSGIGIVTHSRPYAFDLVRGNRRPHTAAADEDPANSLAGIHGLPNRPRKVRVIHRRSVVRPEIQNFMLISSQFSNEEFLELETGMVTCECEFHFSTFRAALATASAVMPKPLNTASTGADMPKVDMPMNSPEDPM